MSFLVNSYLENLWTPVQLGSSLALWLDAADASTITLVSGNVSQWGDKSGNSRHLVQGAVSNRPAYQATGLGGLPTVQFDGVNDFLRNATYSFGNSASTFYCVMQSSVVSGEFASLFIASPIPSNINLITELVYTNNFSGFGGYSTITYKPPTRNSGSSMVGASTTHLTTPQIISAAFDGVGSGPSDCAFSVNGTTLTSTTSGPLGYSVESGFSVGLRPIQGTGPFRGGISEIVFCASFLSSTERQQTEGYLAHKWGLVSNLPINHPYKTSPPTV